MSNEKKAHGEWVFTETEEEMQERLAEEAREAEQKRRQEQKGRESGTAVLITDVFPEHKDEGNLPYIDLNRIFAGVKTNLYVRNRAPDILENGLVELKEPEISYDRILGRGQEGLCGGGGSGRHHGLLRGSVLRYDGFRGYRPG